MAHASEETHTEREEEGGERLVEEESVEVFDFFKHRLTSSGGYKDIDWSWFFASPGPAIV